MVSAQFKVLWSLGAPAFLLLVSLGAGCEGAVEDSKTTVMLLPREVRQIDPRFAADSVSLKVSRLLFASLITIDPQSLDAIPQLADRVVATSDVRYDVSLRPNLHFSDGSRLDAEDVRATFIGLQDPALKSRYAGTYRRIARIEVLDPLHLTFVLDGPHATFVTDLEMPIVRSEDSRRALGDVPVVSGPYRLLSRERGEIHLKANRHYQGPAPRISRLLLRTVRDDNIRTLRMLSGKGDLTVDGVPPLLQSLFLKDERFNVRRVAGVGTAYLGVNTSSRWLKDVRVRRALAHAIDRKAVIRTKLFGAARLARGMVPPGHWAYEENVATYDYNPKRSRELLAEVFGNNQPELVLRCGSERSRVSTARVVASMLRQVGLEVVVRPSELSTLLSDLNHGRFELTLLELPEVLEPHVLSWFFDSHHVPGPGVEGANRWRYRNDQFDAALESGRLATSRRRRQEAYSKVQRMLAIDLPVVPLWHRDVVVVSTEALAHLPVPRHGRYGGLFF